MDTDITRVSRLDLDTVAGMAAAIITMGVGMAGVAGTGVAVFMAVGDTAKISAV